MALSLEQLPAETLTGIIRGLPVLDRFAVMKVSRRLRSIVQREGILPMHDIRKLIVDHKKQVLAAELWDKSRIGIWHKTVKMGTLEEEDGHSLEWPLDADGPIYYYGRIFIPCPIYYHRISAPWEEYVERLIRKASVYFKKSPLHDFEVFFHEDHLPEYLFKFPMKCKHLRLPNSKYSPLPQALRSLVSAVSFFWTDFSLSAHEIRTMDKTVLKCSITAEEARTFLTNISDLPHNIQLWTFNVLGDADAFLHYVCTTYFNNNHFLGPHQWILMERVTVIVSAFKRPPVLRFFHKKSVVSVFVRSKGIRIRDTHQLDVTDTCITSAICLSFFSFSWYVQSRYDDRMLNFIKYHITKNIIKFITRVRVPNEKTRRRRKKRRQSPERRKAMKVRGSYKIAVQKMQGETLQGTVE